MTCAKAESLITAYLDGELSGRDVIELRSHIDSCDSCGFEESHSRRVKGLLSDMQKYQPAEGFENRLYEMVRKESVRAQRTRRIGVPIFAAVAVASMLATLAVVSVNKDRNIRAADAKQRAQVIDFEIQRDQAFFAGSDPLNGRPVVVQSRYAGR